MNIDDRLDHAVRDLRTGCVPTPVPIERLAKRRVRRRNVMLAVLALVVVAGSGLFLATRDSGSARRSIVATGGPDSSASPVTQPAHLPADCKLVSNRSGTLFGCLKASEQPAPGDTLGSGATQPLGNPVYDVETNTKLIGYIGTPAGIGFVPLALVPQYEELVSCTMTLRDSTAILTAQCRQLLLAQGVPESQFDGR